MPTGKKHQSVPHSKNDFSEIWGGDIRKELPRTHFSPCDISHRDLKTRASIDFIQHAHRKYYGAHHNFDRDRHHRVLYKNTHTTILFIASLCMSASVKSTPSSKKNSAIMARDINFKPGVFVTISKVDTSDDMRYTRVFVRVFPQKDLSYAMATLEHERNTLQKISIR